MPVLRLDGRVVKADTIAESKEDENRQYSKYALQQEPRRLVQRGLRSNILEKHTKETSMSQSSTRKLRVRVLLT